MAGDQPHIVGPWITDDQDAADRIELAQADSTPDGTPMLGLRDTNDPQRILYVSRERLQQFVSHAVNGSTKTGQLLGAQASSR